MSVDGIGVYEYGVVTYGLFEPPREYAVAQKTIPDYAFVVLNDNPIAYWRMDVLDPVTLEDYSGQERHATFYNATEFGKDPLTTGGYSALFPSTSYATADISSLFRRGREQVPFTIEMWVRPAEQPRSERLLAGRGEDGVWIVPSGFEFRMRNSDGQLFKTTYIVPHWKTNYHVVAQYAQGQIVLLVNGQVVDGSGFSGSIASNTPTFYLGSPASGPAVFLDEVAVYRGALLHLAVQRHYSAGSAKQSYVDEVVSDGGYHYSFDDSNSRTWVSLTEDLSTGEHNNIAIVGGSITTTGATSGVAFRRESPAYADGILVPTSTARYANGKNYFTAAQSVSIADPHWVGNASVLPGRALAPDGTLSADVMSMPNGSQVYRTANNKSFSPGAKVTVSAWLRASTTRTVRLSFESASTGAVGYGYHVITIGPEWRRYSHTVTIGDNGLVKFLFYNFSGDPISASAPNVEVWHPQMEEGTQPTGWFLGGNSALTIEEGTVNLAKNSSFEIDTNNDGLADGWSIYNNAGAAQPVTATLTTTSPISGNRVQRITWSVDNTATKGIIYTAGGASWIPGAEYTVSFYARASLTATTNMAMYWNKHPKIQRAIHNPLLTTTFQRYIFYLKMSDTPEDSQRFYISIINAFATQGWLEFDAVQVEQKPYVTTYQVDSTREPESAIITL